MWLQKKKAIDFDFIRGRNKCGVHKKNDNYESAKKYDTRMYFWGRIEQVRKAKKRGSVFITKYFYNKI